MHSLRSIRVASASEAARLDSDAIAAGIPSRALMRVAAANAASRIMVECRDELRDGVTVYTGPGNNGGDGWVVAGILARSGVKVHVCEVVAARSDDAVTERKAVLDLVELGEPRGGGIVIDAMLGTGASGEPHGAIAEAVPRIGARRAGGARVIALDIPTGVNATTGTCTQSVRADMTITFGTWKRGHLLARDACGDILVVDMGLPAGAGATLPAFVDAALVATCVPDITFDAHKGMRKKLAIVAGGPGMGGAAILAAQAALRSGIGMVQVVTHPANVCALQARIPEALTKTWPLDDAALQALTTWADVVLLGPGLEANDEMRTLIERVLRTFDGPVVLDAGALTVYAHAIDALSAMLRGRPAVMTPHPVELSRLTGDDVQVIVEQRFEIGLEVARRLQSVVLLKGAPTIITSPDGQRYVSAAGTAALGTAGSGDTLSGIVATLLAQMDNAYHAAACAAWVHGCAAEWCDGVRGVALEDIVAQLPAVWRAVAVHRYAQYPVLAELRSVFGVT